MASCTSENKKPGLVEGGTWTNRSLLNKKPGPVEGKTWTN